MAEDRRKKAVIREVLRRQSCHQMMLVDQDRALHDGSGNLRSRIPEPETMGSEELRAFMSYNRPLNKEIQGPPIQLFLQHCPAFKINGTILDIGCGSGELAVFMSLVFPNLSITGVDASSDCIAEAKKLSEFFRLANPPEFIKAHIPYDTLPRRKFDTVFSRSSLHHFQRGSDFWKTVKRHAKPGANVYVFDLARPITRRGAGLLVEAALSPNASEVNRRIYTESFLSAYRPAEVRFHLTSVGLGLKVKPWDPSHLIVWGELKG